MTTRLAGHVLEGEGRPRLVAGCCGSELTHGEPNQYDRIGHGRCSCGAFGACETTDAARKRWHREHKRGVGVAAAIDEGEVEIAASSDLRSLGSI